MRHRATLEGLKQGVRWQDLEKAWQSELQRFVEIRKRYLIYPE